MVKDPSRKSRKRTIKQPDVDLDLAELARVLAEHSLEQNAAGWFELPWRSGWNVVRLLRELEGTPAALPVGWPKNNAVRAAVVFLDDCLAKGGERLNGAYWEVDDHKVATRGYSRTLSCALRCVQLIIAKSAGDGQLYNDLLLYACENKSPDEIAPYVLDARCRDAIGVGVTLNNDKLDRQRRAFKIAWERGLYHAAYAIKPCPEDPHR